MNRLNFSEREPTVKFAISMPYGDFVFDHEDALKLVEIFERAEKFETKYRSAEDGGTSYHVYREPEKGLNLKHLSPEVYDVARLAGKSEKS